MAHAHWGVVVESLDSGERLYHRNAGKLMMPASNMKIVTVAAAAEVLGWDYRFTTTLETAAPVDGGVLLGDLVVRGSGDPTINARNGRGAAVFGEWASLLRAAGIRTISGRIIGDDRAFDGVALGAGWAWDDLQYGYTAPVGALQLNQNAVELIVSPGAAAGLPAVLHLQPGSGLTLWNRTSTTISGVPETIDYRRHPDRLVLEVTGTVPLPEQGPDAAVAPAPAIVRQVAVVNPTLFFVQSLKDALIAAGIGVEGEAVGLDAAAASFVEHGGLERRILVRTESPPLAEIAAVLMKVSQNLYAEAVLKAMGAGPGGPGTTAAGREAVLATLRRWEIDERSLVMADGSGLSRYNYASADLLVRLLGRMHRDPLHRERFADTLPVAGREGTVSARMRGSRAEGNARAKTGSLANVRALSGYVRTRAGEMLVFSILANNFILPADSVTWIADLAVEVLANFTREP